MIAFPNPSAKRLNRWLDEKPDRFSRYLASHPDVADRYDTETQLRPAVRDALARAVDAPLDLAARLRERLIVDDDTSPASVAVDLLGLGFATAKTLLDPRPDPIDSTRP